jgi:hypothetical protein
MDSVQLDTFAFPRQQWLRERTSCYVICTLPALCLPYLYDVDNTRGFVLTYSPRKLQKIQLQMNFKNLLILLKHLSCENVKKRPFFCKLQAEERTYVNSKFFN